MTGYQVVGKTFGPTITIWSTKEQAQQYLDKEIKPLRPNETWWIIRVRIIGLAKTNPSRPASCTYNNVYSIPQK